MDNLTHTLVGAALAEAGLRKRTPLATAALVIGANLPDMDGLAYFVVGPDAALGFRRGWTHGVPALAVWPWVLAGLLLAWDRWVRRRRDPGAAPADARALLGLSALAIVTHPLLDFLNTYGVRFLMPFRDVWYYGDTLFIVDPWVWLALGTGYLVASRRRRSGAPRPERPARLALALSVAYAVAMGASALAARAVARQEMAARGVAVERLMAGPLPVTPFTRQVVVASGTGYVRGAVGWLRRPAYRDEEPGSVERGSVERYAVPSGGGRAAAVFLHWARFPALVTDTTTGDAALVDLRYTLDPYAGFGALSLPRPAAVPSPPDPTTQEPRQ